MALQFTWDRKKAASNEVKHGVVFEEAATVFLDHFAFIFDDDMHSEYDPDNVLAFSEADNQETLTV